MFDIEVDMGDYKCEFDVLKILRSVISSTIPSDG